MKNDGGCGKLRGGSGEDCAAPPAFDFALRRESSRTGYFCNGAGIWLHCETGMDWEVSMGAIDAQAVRKIAGARKVWKTVGILAMSCMVGASARAQEPKKYEATIESLDQHERAPAGRRRQVGNFYSLGIVFGAGVGAAGTFGARLQFAGLHHQ